LIVRYCNAIQSVMQHEHLMTDEDRLELREIEASVTDARQRRARLMNRLRQRAYRQRGAANA
jgi:hypothetical protein